MAPRSPYCFLAGSRSAFFPGPPARVVWSGAGGIVYRRSLSAAGCVGCRGGSEHPDSDFLVANLAMQDFCQAEEYRHVGMIAQYAAHQRARLTHYLTGYGHKGVDKRFEFQTQQPQL